MKVGRMKQRIIFEKYDYQTDDYGFPIEEWVEYKKVWAEIVPVSGREYFAAATFNHEVTSKIYTRYCEDIDPTMRIRYKNRKFDIQAILRYENKAMMIIMVKENPLDN